MADTGWLSASTYTAGAAGAAWIAVDAARLASPDTSSVAVGPSLSVPSPEAAGVQLSAVGASIPEGNQIDGVEIEFQAWSDEAGSDLYFATELISTPGTKIGVAKDSGVISGSATSGSPSIITVGGASDTWSASLTDSIVNATGFGFRFVVNFNGFSGSNRPRVDSARIKVYYSEAAPAGGTGPEDDWFSEEVRNPSNGTLSRLYFTGGSVERNSIHDDAATNSASGNYPTAQSVKDLINLNVNRPDLVDAEGQTILQAYYDYLEGQAIQVDAISTDSNRLFLELLEQRNNLHQS